MKELRSEIEIDAPPERVWQVLIDFEAYPEWNEFITSIKGEPTVGSRLTVHIEPPGRRGITFKPTVQAVEPARELRSLGRLVTPSLFDGDHRLAIEPLAEGRSRFVQSEHFTGLLVGLFDRTLEATERGFERMNAALKRRAEAT